MSNYTYKFQIGDVVTKANGKKTAIVTRLPNANPTGYGRSALYHCKYEHSNATFTEKVNGKETHYLGNSGSSLKKGDVVMLTDANSNYSIGKVTGVDTKNRTPREKFNGVKLVTEPI